MSYGAFARYYDELTADVDYPLRAKNIDGYVKKYGGRVCGSLVDLACGTGSLSIELARLGYQVTGVDLSYEMLSMALEKKLDCGVPVQFVHQDMRELKLFGNIDVAVCMLDSLNHLSSAEEITRVFERVSQFLAPSSLFVFDVNTEYKHRYILGDNAYVFETPSVFCAWQNNFYPEKCEVHIRLDFFEKADKLYRRYSESFSEFAYSGALIADMLENTGFEILETVDFDTGKIPDEEAQKVIYITRKA